MTTEGLKPCPFCGGEAEIERYGTPRQSTIYTCTDCGCSLETGEEWDHGRWWNARPSPPASPDVAEVLEKLRKWADIAACEDPFLAGSEDAHLTLYGEAAATIERLVREKAEMEADLRLIRDRIPMNYLEGRTLPEAMKEYSEARWRIIERCKTAEAKLSQLEASPGAGWREQVARIVEENVMAEVVYTNPSVGEELIVTGIQEAADALAALSAAPSSPASPPEDVGALREAAWLIEWPADRQNPVRYWHPTEGHVIDPQHAVRFCRREDAEAMAKREHLFGGARVVEHIFGLAVASTQPKEDGR